MQNYSVTATSNFHLYPLILAKAFSSVGDPDCHLQTSLKEAHESLQVAELKLRQVLHIEPTGSTASDSERISQPRVKQISHLEKDSKTCLTFLCQNISCSKVTTLLLFIDRYSVKRYFFLHFYMAN